MIGENISHGNRECRAREGRAREGRALSRPNDADNADATERVPPICADATERVPPLRFKGFDGEWVEKRLGDSFEERDERSAEGELLSVTMNSGVIRASENGKFDNSSSDKSHYKVVKIGDIAYNSMRMWQGACGASAYNGIVSPAYTVLVPIDNNNPSFFQLLFKRKETLNIFRSRSQGLTPDTWNLKFPLLKDILVSSPKVDEQKQIAELFRSLDALIAGRETSLEKLKELKKAMLEKMFPQAGARVPEIRFKGFTGDWVEKRLGEIVTKRNESGVSGDLPKVEYEDVVSFEGVLKNDVQQIQAIKHGIVFHSCDVLFGKLRPYLGNWLYAEFDGIAVGDWWVLKPNGIESSFLYVLIQARHFQETANQSAGSKMPRADWRLVSETQYLLPPTLAEQKRIGSYFRSLDALIAGRREEVEKLRQMKKAMLDRLFV